jgi:RHS repeat-associated protein
VGSSGYDDEDRLVNWERDDTDVDNDSSDDMTYQYDALGRRVQRDDGTTATVFVQNGQQTFADYTSGTAATSPTYNYVYASYIDEPVYRDGTGGERYYHRNQQYSITAVTDSSGTIKERYAYDAYGGLSIFDGSGTARTAMAEGNRYLYTGREWDEDLSLYHYRDRMYDPLCGRFLSRDPIGFEGSPWGLYQYVDSSPLNSVDPMGRQRRPTIFRVHACCDFVETCDDPCDGTRRRFFKGNATCQATIKKDPKSGKLYLDYDPLTCCQRGKPSASSDECHVGVNKASNCSPGGFKKAQCEKDLDHWLRKMPQDQGSQAHKACLVWCEQCMASKAGPKGTPGYGITKKTCIERVCNVAFYPRKKKPLASSLGLRSSL